MQRVLLCIALTLFTVQTLTAQPKNLGTKQRPIRLTGLRRMLSRLHTSKTDYLKGVSARANVVWTLVQQGGTATDSYIPLYRDKTGPKVLTSSSATVFFARQ